MAIVQAQPILGRVKMVQAEHNAKQKIHFCMGIVEAQPILGRAKGGQAEQNAKKKKLYQEQIDSLNKVIETRNELIQKLKTDSLYKEEILRTRYGMSREDEKVFQLVK